MMQKLERRICSSCGSSSFKSVDDNTIQCEYCDTIYITKENCPDRKVGFEINLNGYHDRFRDDTEKINNECEEILNSHHNIITLLNQCEDNYLEEKYNRCIEIEVKRKKLNRVFLILMIVSLVLSGLTGGVSAPFSVVFLFCIVWNDSRQKTRNAQAFIKQYLSERV